MRCRNGQAVRTALRRGPPGDEVVGLDWLLDQVLDLGISIDYGNSSLFRELCAVSRICLSILGFHDADWRMALVVGMAMSWLGFLLTLVVLGLVVGIGWSLWERSGDRGKNGEGTKE